MLSNFEIALYALSVVIVLPIAVWHLLTGSKVPENSWASKYYRAEKYLGPISNVFLLFVCASGLVRLSAHFGLVEGRYKDVFSMLVGAPFMVLLMLELSLWARAAWKVRAAKRDSRS